jgi:hypothetical protein
LKESAPIKRDLWSLIYTDNYEEIIKEQDKNLKENTKK